MIISEYFAGLAKRLGIPEDSEELKTLLGMTGVIPEALSAKLNGLMTESEAKNNLTVKNHFVATFANGIDMAIPQLLTQLGLDPAIIEEIKAETKTGKKVELALTKLHEAESAKAKATANKDPEALQKANEQIKAANLLVTKTKEEYEAKLVEKDNSLNAYKQKNELSKLLSQQLLKTPWSETIPETIRETVFNELLKSEMTKLGTAMMLTGDKLVLKQTADPTLDFHYQNKEFTPSDLVAKVMTDNKLIAVAKPVTERTIMTGLPTTLPDGTAKRTAPSAYQKALQQSMADQVAQP
jgi:hypothetical protein